MPHEVLGLSPGDLGIALLCLEAADVEAAREIRGAEGVMPVVVIGG